MRGNNDFFSGLEENETIERNGLGFRINHYPHTISCVELASDCYIFGQTHKPFDKK